MTVNRTSDHPHEIKWIGPFAYGPNGLERSWLDGHAPDESELDSVQGKAGLYVIVGDHPIHGPRSLLYIGKSKAFENRFCDHHEWLKDEWRIEVYLAKEGRKSFRDEAEKLLIFAHSPAYNTQNIDSLKLKRPLRLWNTGRFWALFPEISSKHPWYERTKLRLDATTQGPTK